MKKCERCGTNFDSTINMCPNCGSTMVVEISDIEALNTESAEQIPATVKPVEKEEENNNQSKKKENTKGFEKQWLLLNIQRPLLKNRWKIQ